jgi:triosephosphate isomerase
MMYLAFGIGCIAEVVVSPPYVFLPVVKSLLRPEFQVAAQNCWVKKGGAFTGEVRLVFNSLLSDLT